MKITVWLISLLVKNKESTIICFLKTVNADARLVQIPPSDYYRAVPVFNLETANTSLSLSLPVRIFN